MIQMATNTLTDVDEELTSITFIQYKLNFNDLVKWKEQLQVAKQDLAAAEQFVTLLTVTGESPQLTACKDASIYYRRLVIEITVSIFLASMIITLDVTTGEEDMYTTGKKAKLFEKEDGPFVRCLDTALATFNVERQAYYSGTFVGNHRVNRTLKVNNYIIKF